MLEGHTGVKKGFTGLDRVLRGLRGVLGCGVVGLGFGGLRI